VRMPSVDSLLIIADSAENIRGTMRTLGIPGLAQEVRERQYDNLVQARETYEAAWAVYEPPPDSGRGKGLESVRARLERLEGREQQVRGDGTGVRPKRNRRSRGIESFTPGTIFNLDWFFRCQVYIECGIALVLPFNPPTVHGGKQRRRSLLAIQQVMELRVRSFVLQLVTANLPVILEFGSGPPHQNATQWVKFIDAVPQPFDSVSIPYHVTLKCRYLILTALQILKVGCNAL